MTTQNIKYSNAMEEITTYIKARVPIIWVQTHEEMRFISELKQEFCDKNKRDLFLWSAYHGVLHMSSNSAKIETHEKAKGTEADTMNASKALSWISGHQVKTTDLRGAVFVLKDFHSVMADPVVLRQMRDIYKQLTDEYKCIIIVSPFLGYGNSFGAGIHPNIEKQIVVVEYGFPTRDQILDNIRRNVDHLNKSNNKKKEYTEEEIIDFAKALQGLTMSEIENVMASSIVHLKELNLKKFIHEKRTLIKKSNVLEFIDTDISLNDVGGLDVAKQFLIKYKDADSDQAQAFGVEPLKGVLLTGIPGTGKSLLAKAIGTLWKKPLLHFDVGKVMTGLVGGSEAKMREVIQQAESLAPCVTGDTKVELSDGRKLTMEELHNEITDANTLNKEYKIRTSIGFSNVHSVIRRSAEDKKLLKITTKFGHSIIVTDNHKLMTKDGTWKEAKDLTLDDDLMEID